MKAIFIKVIDKQKKKPNLFKRFEPFLGLICLSKKCLHKIDVEHCPFKLNTFHFGTAFKAFSFKLFTIDFDPIQRKEQNVNI